MYHICEWNLPLQKLMKGPNGHQSQTKKIFYVSFFSWMPNPDHQKAKDKYLSTCYNTHKYLSIKYMMSTIIRIWVTIKIWILEFIYCKGPNGTKTGINRSCLLHLIIYYTVTIHKSTMKSIFLSELSLSI